MSVPFHIIAQGERLCATYELDGHHLTVRSAYGTKRVVRGLAKPEKLAKTLLRVIVRDVVALTPLPTVVKAKPDAGARLN